MGVGYAADTGDQSRSARLVIDALDEREIFWVVFRITITALHATVFIQLALFYSE